MLKNYFIFGRFLFVFCFFSSQNLIFDWRSACQISEEKTRKIEGGNRNKVRKRIGNIILKLKLRKPKKKMNTEGKVNKKSSNRITRNEM